MNTDQLTALTSLVTQIFLAMYVLMLVEFRPPVRLWRRRWVHWAGALVAANVLWMAAGNGELYRRYGTLTLLLPYMLITLWCSAHRNARTLFGVSNASYVGCICGINGYVVQLLFPELTFLPLAVRVASLAAMYFVMRRFAKTCRAMFRQLQQGWLALWMIPLITSLLSFTISARFFRTSPLLSSMAIYGLLTVCSIAYYLMYLFFEQVETKNKMETDQKLLALQVSGLQERIRAVNAAESRLRIQRHDLRHRLQLVQELVQRGEPRAAMELVDAAQQQLSDLQPRRWCSPPVLDAVFSSYFDKARENGIRVDARLAFPEPLPAEEGELAIVFANALENAIHACMQLPEAERRLRCVSLAQPGLMLELSNPCREAVRFDEQGLPVSERKGHGLGSQSIAAFCQKYGAVYQFKLEDSWFTLRIIL